MRLISSLKPRPMVTQSPLDSMSCFFSLKFFDFYTTKWRRHVHDVTRKVIQILLTRKTVFRHEEVVDYSSQICPCLLLLGIQHWLIITAFKTNMGMKVLLMLMCLYCRPNLNYLRFVKLNLKSWICESVSLCLNVIEYSIYSSRMLNVFLSTADDDSPCLLEGCLQLLGDVSTDILQG